MDKAIKNSNSNEKIDPAVLKIVWILLIGMLAPLFDTTIMNVAIDTLGNALDAPVSMVQWVMTSYLIALGAIIPVSGWLLDRFGDKNIWIFALSLFLIGSILSSLAWSIESLILFRAIQGLGGGLMMPIMQTMVVRATGGEKLGKLMAIVGLPVLLGPILGPVLGGIIINALNWRWIFYVNIPIVAVALILAIWHLPKDSAPKKTQKLDVIGLLLLTPPIILIIYGLTVVSDYNGFFNQHVMIPIGVGIIILILFCMHALKKQSNAIINILLFKSRSFTASSCLLFLLGLTTFGGMLLLPLYFQQVRGASVLIAGLLLIPQGIGMLLTRSLAGKLTDTIGSRWVVFLSTILTILGTIPFIFSNADTSILLISLTLILRGAGLGGIMISIMASVYIGLSKEDIPHASSMTRILQQIGGAFGASILAIILQSQLSSLNAMGITAINTAFNHTFMWTTIFTVISLIFALFLPNKLSKNHSTAD
ncbi:EmrB/QacA subfamily drug resistance transporter [Virgibacillus halotolerans]|uniref:MDR family MFS transporter n=1 Tax=Virgibacillus halotolerans TaxID=1071053 RepID=UPI00195FB107|nr:MDR family MFS transporter [Virgibacillus halotolerans]MBM7601476.1 EmrB/QacA subfamily drug resistance transporter [Virgibacillus halotolerans]